MAWRILPSAPEALSRIEWWLWFVAAALAIIGVLFGVAAREVGRHKATILQGRLDEALRQRDEKAKALENKTRDLEARQAPRRLTPTQHAELVRLLSAKPVNAAPVMVASIPGDAESFQFATELMRVLQETGWNPGDVYPTTAFNAGFGVAVIIGDRTNPPPGASLLLESLKQIGIQVEGVQVPQWGSGRIRVSVGTKPS